MKTNKKETKKETSKVDAEKNGTAKKSNKKKRTKSMKFDDTVAHEYRAYVQIAPGHTEYVDFTVSPTDQPDGHLTYDTVENKAYDEIERHYPEEYFPRADISGHILIKADFGKGIEWVPVLSESSKDVKKALKSKLVLPDATYALSDEFMLYIEMKKNGLLPADMDFDYNVMHEKIDVLKKLVALL